MYIIINKTKNTRTDYEGDWPGTIVIVERELDEGDRIIIISLYSNSIKVPYFVDYNGVKMWEWETFDLI